MSALLIEVGGKMRQVGPLLAVSRASRAVTQIDVTSLDSVPNTEPLENGEICFEVSKAIGVWRKRYQQVKLTAIYKHGLRVELGGLLTKLKRSNKTKRTSITIRVSGAVSMIEP